MVMSSKSWGAVDIWRGDDGWWWNIGNAVVECEVESVSRAVDRVEVCNSLAHVIQSCWIMLLRLETLDNKEIIIRVSVIESNALSFNWSFRHFIGF